MALEKVSATTPLDRPTLHSCLREWYAVTSTSEAADPTIGPIGSTDGPLGVTSWLHVRDEAGRIFCLHADVKRSAVKAYLDLVDEFGDDLQWKIVTNQRGKENAVAYGPNEMRITSFYMYLNSPNTKT